LISSGREGYAMNLDLEREKSHLNEIIRNFRSTQQSTPKKKGAASLLEYHSLHPRIPQSNR
jgi:hypothetical protein